VDINGRQVHVIVSLHSSICPDERYGKRPYCSTETSFGAQELVRTNKHDPADRNGGNSHNGSRSRTVTTEIGPAARAIRKHAVECGRNNDFPISQGICYAVSALPACGVQEPLLSRDLCFPRLPGDWPDHRPRTRDGRPFPCPGPVQAPAGSTGSTAHQDRRCLPDASAWLSNRSTTSASTSRSLTSWLPSSFTASVTSCALPDGGEITSPPPCQDHDLHTSPHRTLPNRAIPAPHNNSRRNIGITTTSA
jgi:hypothetical protein